MAEGNQAALRIICGPTAAGKSAVAMAIAEREGAAIISADSRQVYRGFDIGTAKPDAAERARVPHYGIDVADPGERYSAARWAEGAGQWIAHAESEDRVTALVGGTGFYLRALTTPLFAEPTLDAVKRRSLASELDALSTSELRRWVSHLDPIRASLGRTQLLRAVEVALLTGERISAWHDRTPRVPGRPARYLVVDPGAALHGWIEARVRRMLAAGWADEVRGLRGSVPADAPAWKATGYQRVRELVEGSCDVEGAIRQIVIDTRQYAKRQRTWFRHQLAGASVTRLDSTAPDVLERALVWWREVE